MYPDDCAGLTKSAVASIHRRCQSASPANEVVRRSLSVSTVRKIHTMLQGAWKFGINHDLIPCDRAHVIADTPLPARAKDERKPEIVCWTPEQYRRFLEWAAVKRLDAYAAFFFSATSGERVSANLGLHWDEVNLETATANLVCFVEVPRPSPGAGAGGAPRQDHRRPSYPPRFAHRHHAAALEGAPERAADGQVRPASLRGRRAGPPPARLPRPGPGLPPAGRQLVAASIDPSWAEWLSDFMDNWRWGFDECVR
jgi:hypothetical protein